MNSLTTILLFIALTITPRGHPHPERRAAFHLICILFQCKLQEIQNEWWTNLTKRTQQYADRGDYRGFCKALKAVYGLTHWVQSPLHSVDGQVLFTDKGCILSRWSEHFQSLFSADCVVLDPAVLHLPQQLFKGWTTLCERNYQSHRVVEEWQGSGSWWDFTKPLERRRISMTVSSMNSLSVVGSRANFQVISAMQSLSPVTKTKEKNQIAPTIRGSICSSSQEKSLFMCS